MPTMSGLPLLFAIGASLAGALAAVFQSRGARELPHAPSNPLRLILRLLRRPIWLVGVAFAGLSGFCHAIALREGSLIEVEAVLVTSLLFALGLGIVISRAKVSIRDWLGASATVIGLVCFLGFADPQDGDYDVETSTWVIALCVLLLALGLLITAAAKVRSPNLRASLWGSAAAVFLGSAAVMLKSLDSTLDEHGPTSVILLTLAILGIFELGALITQQLAFRSGDLAAALAPFVGGNPLVAGAVGIVIFAERFHHDPADLIGGALGLTMVFAGIWVLAASPLVAAGSGEDLPVAPGEHSGVGESPALR